MFIENGWKNFFQKEMEKSYFQNLCEFLKSEYATKRIFPKKHLVFNAFEKTDLKNVKIVILGQDPYHNEGQAMGLSFSVPKGSPLPPSLKNIFQEIKSDLGIFPSSGDLSPWAENGVFLLNSLLTVEKNKPLSHMGKGWETFTDNAIREISKTPGKVFLLWGSSAMSKKALISGDHLILEAPHPSPLSAYRGFFGCKHFSKANSFLEKSGREVDFKI